VVIDDQLRELSSTPHIGPPNEGPRPHTAVNRRTLRQILLGRLGDSLRFGSTVVGYEEAGDRVTVKLDDGSTEEGDLLVGADGIRSAVRAQRLPQTTVVEAGVEGLGVFGRSPLPPALQEEIPSMLLDGFVIATNQRGGMLAMGAFNPRRPPAEAAAELAPDVTVDPVDDYMMVSGSLAPDTHVPPSHEWTEETPAMLRDSMLRAVEGWHPALRGIVARIDPATVFAIPFGRLEPTPAWEPSRVTLLGDAIHAMLPTLGQGANTALGDAARLNSRLADFSDPIGAVAEYEQEMRDHVYPIMEMAADHSRFGGGGLSSN
jgi:2-polyprenyl-6-methoxyphenol hydroxylase-like FAD-dependent oxidoreductase